MEKIVYVYGSGRDASTRSVRRASTPRQTLVRLGPWIIRPARRTPVQFVQLSKYEADVLAKVRQGIIQIQNGDTVVYTVDQLKASFAELKTGSSAPDFMTMPIAELYELMRVDAVTQEVWDAFVARCAADSDIDRPSLPDMATRVSGLQQFMQQNAGRLDLKRGRELVEAMAMGLKLEDIKAEQQRAAEALAAKAAENATVDQAAIETQPAPPEPDPEPTPEEPSEPAQEDPEQMDFSEPETEEPAPAADERAGRALQLPEGWKGLTNTKLIEMMSGLGIPVPERQNKASLTAAVEKWVEGS